MIFPDLFLEGEIFPEKGESYCFALESPGWPFINRVRTRTLKGLDTQTSDHCVLSSRWPCVGRQPNGHERVRELGILMSHRSEFSVGKSHLPIVHFPFLLFIPYIFSTQTLLSTSQDDFSIHPTITLPGQPLLILISFLFLIPSGPSRPILSFQPSVFLQLISLAFSSSTCPVAKSCLGRSYRQWL